VINEITKDGRQLILGISPPVSTSNKEFILRIAPNIVKGTHRQSVDTEYHEIRFTGPLSPVWALPEQIKKRLAAFLDSVTVPISDYDLYKLILEKSMYVRDVLHITATPENILQINKLVICLVLKDLFVNGTVINGQIKSRELLNTRIEYYKPDSADALKQLDDCINDGSVLSENAFAVQIGIRSERFLNRPTKQYPATYR
jgi:hypothetical protein